MTYWPITHSAEINIFNCYIIKLRTLISLYRCWHICSELHQSFVTCAPLDFSQGGVVSLIAFELISLSSHCLVVGTSPLRSLLALLCLCWLLLLFALSLLASWVQSQNNTGRETTGNLNQRKWEFEGVVPFALARNRSWLWRHCLGIPGRHSGVPLFLTLRNHHRRNNLGAA